MSQNPPTFAERVKGKEKSSLKRPNCLHFKTKANLKRHEVIDLLKEMKFECEKLEGVGEMKHKKIDITCKNRKYLLELYEQLKSNDSVYEVQLYESDNVNVILGWVPIPLPNETIQQSIEEVFGKVIKISEKKYKDGLKSGIRILTMNKNELETNPLPSYIFIDGFELYVTYKGQTVTCRFCGETGHVQMNCEKRMLEFPKLDHTFYNQETDNMIKKSKFVQMHAQKRDAVANSSLPFVSEAPINLSKKRKLLAEARVDLTSEEIRSVRLFDKVCCSTPTLQTQQAVICDAIEIDLNDSLGEEMRSDNMVNENLAVLPTEDRWDMACEISCLSCHSKNDAKVSDNKLTCRECEEQQYVAKPCCSDITSRERFSLKFNERYADCSICHSEMIRLPCCDQFQPKMQVSENIWDCVQCSKYSVTCSCKQVSLLPSKSMRWKCDNFNCANFIVNCDCSRVIIHDLKSSYRCPCGFEYENDVTIGVKIT